MFLVERMAGGGKAERQQHKRNERGRRSPHPFAIWTEQRLTKQYPDETAGTVQAIAGGVLSTPKSCVATSPVAAFTSGGPPRKIVPCSRTITVSSLIAGT